jgi:hypothetical protein
MSYHPNLALRSKNVLSIVATSARDNRLGVLEHTKLRCKHNGHAEVGGVTDGRYWVGTNPTTGGGIVLEGIDIDERYGIFRPFKRGAITRAQEAGVSESDVNRVGQ